MAGRLRSKTCIFRKEGRYLKGLGVDVPDIYLTTIEFENGVVAHMENGWVTPNGNRNINDFRCSVMCTEGMISLDLSSHNLIEEVTEEKQLCLISWYLIWYLTVVKDCLMKASETS